MQKAISSHSENVITYSPCICVNDDTAGGGSHSHSGYTVDHEIDEVREECDNKFAALKSEWGMKQLALEAEKNYWQQSIISLFKQLLYTTTLGKFTTYTICISIQPIFTQNCTTIMVRKSPTYVHMSA